MKKTKTEKEQKYTERLNLLQDSLGYRFNNIELLKTALTHSSFANERAVDSYERLEFLGDSLLGFVTAKHLYASNQPLPEGKMSRVRAEYVCETALCAMAEKLNIGAYLRLGRGEQLTGGRQRASILADAIESITAAIFLDSGAEAAENFLMEKVLCEIDFSAPAAYYTCDNKSLLQELVQKKGNTAIKYQTIGEEGPDHSKTFTVGVYLNGELFGTGSGKTKRNAGQQAAGATMEMLNRATEIPRGSQTEETPQLSRTEEKPQESSDGETTQGEKS